MITIYGSDGIAKTQVPCDDNSTQAKELQGDNVLTLSFTLYGHVELEVGDYAVFLEERYLIMEQYKPEQVSTMEWKYDIKLYGIESLVNRFLVLNDTDGADEPVFTLTAPPREHVALIVRSINNGMETTDWKVGEVTGTDNIVIDYQGKYCGDALKEVAEKAGNRAEWWMDGLTVNVCRCERGEEITLGYGKGLTGLSCDMADNAQFYTRLYPLGSSRNIDPEKYGHTRLQLPGGLKHVDVNVEKYGVWHRYEEAAFADIYPRYTGTVSSVRSEEVTGEDGEPFTVWYFKDDSLPFDPNDYEIGGKVKRVSFQEGSALAGLGTEEDGTYFFEANYHSDTREWEIITVWPYGDDTQLPNGTLCPKPGDRYIPWNIRMPDEYYTLAEQEYLDAVLAYNEENALDVSRYKAPTDHVYIEDNAVDLYIGRKVRLESDKYFPETGYRSSRITKITRKVNLPSQMDLEISDAVSVGTRESINESIEGVRNYIRESSGSFPDVVRSWEDTPLSDYNVLSALNSLMKFMRKDRPDKTEYLMKFLAGLECGNFAKGSAGVGIYQDEQGNWHIETDYLDVRLKFTATEVEIQKAYHIGGQQIKSAASLKCVRVEEREDSYRCYMNTTDDDGNEISNDFRVNDQAYVNTFNLVKQADGKIGNHFLWRLVTAVGANYIDLSKTVCAAGSDAPVAGDEMVLLGYQGTDAPDRQAAVIDAGAGDGAPYYRQFVGIDSFNLPAPETQLKPGDNLLSGRVHIEQGSTGWKNMDGLPEEIQDAADLAADAYNKAESAKELADGAAQAATDAQDRLDGWAEDGVISPTEKLTLKQELENLQAEYESNLADAQKYGIDAAAYTTAWNAYKAELEYHSADTPETIEVRPAFATSQAAFYEARTALLGAIADKAKEYVDTSIGNIGVGSVNLLRNSGFTGNYETENLNKDTQLVPGTEMYSKALQYWSGNAEIQEDADAVSGRSAVLGSLSQQVSLIANEVYVISYRAKGTSVSVSCGEFGATQSVSSSTYMRYVHKFTFSGNATFRISGTATVCDLQLERGTIATDWKPSPLDNDKTAARFQSIQYIADVIKNGSVDILGGLILAGMIQLGNYRNGELEKVTAGISGIYNDDDDVYTWGGGTLEQAIRTVMAYKENPDYEPTEAELRDMANIVLTHGGRAILNDVVVRGYIHALGGVFRGTVFAEDGVFKGTVSGINGSFKQLSCVNEDGETVGTVSFDASGRMWFSGDLYHQGTKDGRSLRWYASDMWVRGGFGARERNTARIDGNRIYYYTDGVSEGAVSATLESGTDSGGNTYYIIPCYGLSGDSSGMPVDTLVFANASGTFNYLLSMAGSQRVTLINVCNGSSASRFYVNGVMQALDGGCAFTVQKVPEEWLNPAVSDSILGSGLMVIGKYDNNWNG